MADERPELTVRWDAELRRLGRAAVIARLENGGAHANSDYKLFVSGLRAHFGGTLNGG
jgi:hypothetical protein